MKRKEELMTESDVSSVSEDVVLRSGSYSSFLFLALYVNSQTFFKYRKHIRRKIAWQTWPDIKLKMFEKEYNKVRENQKETFPLKQLWFLFKVIQPEEVL